MNPAHPSALSSAFDALRLMGCVMALGLPACSRDKAPPPAAPPTATPPAAPKPVSAPPVAPAPAPGHTPLVDWPALTASEGACADCHPDVAQRWAESRMGRTFRHLDAESRAPLATPGKAEHPTSHLVYSQAAGVVTERADADNAFSRPPEFAFGSGTHVFTYAWRERGRLLQVPMSWYRGTGWDLSPGFAQIDQHPGFFREIAPACVSCHANPPGVDPETHEPGVPTGSFGCSRCHGDGRAHVAGRLAGEATPIANPQRMSPDRAADVCARCHFTGDVRLAREGRAVTDFLAGGDLSDVIAIFVRQDPVKGFSSTDHAQRLALSACARQTPDLNCTTCHHPHSDSAADRAVSCQGCHSAGGGAAEHACPDPGAMSGEKDCVSCHMDEGPTRNIPHVSATDHFIRKRPVAEAPLTNTSPLVWVAHPELAPTDPDHQILLGRAYVQVFQADGQPDDARRAQQWLERGLAARPDQVAGWLDLATLWRLLNQGPGLRQAADRAFALAPKDRRAASLAAWGRLITGDAVGALAALDVSAKVVDLAETETLRAQALSRLGRGAEALKAAALAVELRPTYAEGWFALGVLRSQAGDLSGALDGFQRARAWEPRDLRVYIQLGALSAKLSRWAESAVAWAQAEQHAGDDARALGLALRGQVEAQLQLGQPKAARPVLERLQRAEPRADVSALRERLEGLER